MKNVFKVVLKILPFLLYSIFGVALLYFLFKLAIIDYNSETPNNPITNITAIITCLIATTSLFVTIYHSSQNRKARNKERIQDIEYYWYKALLVDKFLPMIFDFFSLCKNQLVDSLETINKQNQKNNLKHSSYMKLIKKEFTEPFTTRYTGIQEELITTAAIINDNLSLKLKKEFENFQDTFINFSQMQTPDYKKMKQCVIETQKNIISLIKKHNENIVE